MQVAVYPGSFDPITLGHMDIIRRAASMVDRLVVGILINDAKHTMFSLSDREKMAKAAVSGFPNVEVKVFQGLLVDFVTQENASFVIRGLRNADDFSYEMSMASVNLTMNPKAETVFFPAGSDFAHISSSLVRTVICDSNDFSPDSPVAKLVPVQILPILQHILEVTNEKTK